MWQFAIPAVASLVGGMMANDANADIASANNAFNAEEAKRSRDWQEHMFSQATGFSNMQATRQMDFQQYNADTQWQRSVQDLTKAGLNPMLAYMKGPNAAPTGAMASASTPGGATASSSGNPTMRDVLTPAVTTAFGMAEINKRLDQIEAQTRLIGAQTTTEKGRPSLVSAQTNLADMQSQLAISSANQAEWTAQKLAAEIPKIAAEVNNIKADTENKYVQWRVNTTLADLHEVHKRLMEKEIPLREATTRVQEALAKLHNLAIPRATNEANVQDTWWMRNISPYLPDLLKGSSAISKVR